MAKLPTPAGVSAALSTDKKQLTVRWGAVPGAKSFVVTVINTNDPAVTYSTTPVADATATTTNVDGTKHTPKDADWANHYQVRVVAKAETAADDSAPGLTFWWTVSPSITMILGGKPITLTMSRDSGGVKTFTLPVSEEAPMTVTLAELKDFISKLAGGLGIPDLPNFTPPGTLLLSRFVISTDGFFDMSLKYALNASDPSAGWTVFPGLTIKDVGLDVLHTNGVDHA